MEYRSFISFLILLPIIVLQTSALLLVDKGVVRPNDPYVHYGDNLVLWCNLTRPDIRQNSSNLFFQLQDEVIPRKFIRIVNTKSIKLVYPVTLDKFECSNKLKRFDFQCFVNKTAGPEFLDNQLVQVNYALKPPIDFECRVDNWEYMKCTWNLSTPYCNYNDINVTLVYVVGNSYHQDCSMATRTSCTWTESIFQTDMTYNMKILVENVKTKAKAETPILTINTRDKVEPAPVTNFIVSRDRSNSTCLVASWDHMLKHRKRQYKVEIKSEFEEVPKMKLLFEQDNYTICGLLPHTLYTISVSNIPIHDDRRANGFWSDTVETIVRTAEDIPGGAPGLAAGCFATNICEDFNCGMQVYWKPVDQELRNGLIDQYKIQATNPQTGEEFIFLAAGNQTSFRLNLPQRRREEYVVDISARTSKGYSKHTASMIIPSIEKAPNKVENLVVEAMNSTGNNQYLIQWSDDEQEDVFSYTLYYCRRSDRTLDCRETISWQTLDPHKRTTMLELAMDKLDFNWHQIGISREIQVDGEIKSSGIEWNRCVYIKDTKPLSGPENVRFPDLQPNQALLIEWDRLDCTDIKNTAHVTSYLLHICKVAHRNGRCIGEEQNITVSNKLTKYEFGNLEPSGLYQITVQGVSRAGVGPKTAPISSHVTDNRLNIGEISGIVIGCMFVLALILFAILRCIRIAQKEKKNCKNMTRIVLPNFSPAEFESKSDRVQSRPLPKPPIDSSQNGGADSGFEGEEGQYEPVGSPQNSRKSITSKTILINNMESQDTFNQLSPGDTSPYAVSDITKGPCVHPVNISTGPVQTSQGTSQAGSSAPPIDSYTQLGLEDYESSDDFPNITNNLQPHTDHIVGFVTQPNVPNNLFPTDSPYKSAYCEKIQNKARRPQTVAIPPAKPPRHIPMILPTENSDSSEDFTSDYVPLEEMIKSPPRQNHPVVCELVSPSGDIHNTQTLLIRRRDPMRPLSDYMHNLPQQFFVEPDKDQEGPTTEL